MGEGENRLKSSIILSRFHRKPTTITVILSHPCFSYCLHLDSAYLLNVVNTVNENSITNAVNVLREKRTKVVIDDAPIVMTNEFARLLETFKPIGVN